MLKATSMCKAGDATHCLYQVVARIPLFCWMTHTHTLNEMMSTPVHIESQFTLPALLSPVLKQCQKHHSIELRNKARYVIPGAVSWKSQTHLTGGRQHMTN